MRVRFNQHEYKKHHKCLIFLICSIYVLLCTDTGLSVSQSLQVLSCHIPFLVSSVEDFKDHIPRETDMKVKHNHRLLRLMEELHYVVLMIIYEFVCFQVAMNVYELSSAAGLPCEIDPALVVALSSQKSGKTQRSFSS